MGSPTTLRTSASNVDSVPQGGITVTTGIGAAYVSNATLISGERNPDSLTNSYLLTRPESNLAVISSTATVTIGSGAANDTHLFGMYITTALTGSVVITGFADTAGTAQAVTLPSATAAGFKDFFGAINSAGALTMCAGNATDDNVVLVFWRPV